MKSFRAVKLKDSKLCMDCNHIYSGRTCPVCASESAMPISRMINPVAHQFPFHNMTVMPDPAKLRNIYSDPEMRFSA